MKKPNDYENVEVGAEYTPLELGGHICKIMEVKEQKSSNGLDMLVISLDTDKSDSQPNYFSDKFKNDTRETKKWGCVVYLVVDESNEYGAKNLKTFCTSVERSNNGFNTVWGDGFANCFKGKLVGGVFGREEYQKDDGDYSFFTKCKYFRSIDGVKDANIPKDKLMDKSNQSQISGDGFMPANDSEQDLPFR